MTLGFGFQSFISYYSFPIDILCWRRQNIMGIKTPKAQTVDEISKYSYKATIVAMMAATSAPHALSPRIEAAPLSELEVVVAAATAWMPKVVPVKTWVEPPVVTVVVTVAGTGAAVVVLQPDQVPVQEECEPQPAVQVVQESQLIPEAFVPHGPPNPPGPPWPPGPPL
jgi:hypothetical protein